MNIDHRNLEGKSALIAAAESGQPDSVRALLALGADPTLRDNKGHTARQHAEQKRFNDIVRLMEGAGAQ